MNAPPNSDRSHQMFCRKCGYALIGLASNRCPECGREFDPGNPKSFLNHPPRIILRRIVKVLLVLCCLTLPVDSYIGYLAWQVHREKKAIQILVANGAQVGTYDTTPNWAKSVLHGHAAWLWERAASVDLDRLPDNFNNTPQCMSAVKNLSSLRFLYLWPAPVTDSDLANLKSLTALQLLDLHGTSVTDAGLVNLKGLTALEELDMDDTSVTDAGLVNLKGLTDLQTLSLNHTVVTNTGLANLKGLMALQTLFLDYTLVTDAGLVNLKGLTALQELHLCNIPVTDAGLANLKGLVALRKLYLIETSVTDAGLVNLKGLTALRELYLGGTLVTDKGVVDLQASLSKCDVSH